MTPTLTRPNPIARNTALVFLSVLVLGLFFMSLDAPVNHASQQDAVTLTATRVASVQTPQTQPVDSNVQFADAPAIRQPVIASTQELNVPISIRFVQADSSVYTTQRSYASAQMALDNANLLWEPAHVHFSILDDRYVSVMPSDLTRLLSVQTVAEVPSVFSTRLNPNPNVPVVYFVGTLGGPNGLTVHDAKIAFVADHSSSSDYRTLAHELGHVVGLEHVTDEDNLMASGQSGTTLTESQIESARQGAQAFATFAS